MRVVGRFVEAVYKRPDPTLQAPESVRASRWHVHCFTYRKARLDSVMVEFVRDVIVAVAVLATLIAVAVHASSDAEPLSHGASSGNGAAIGAPLVLSPGPVPVSVTQPK